MNWVQRIQMEALENYLFFCTLTYNNDMLPHVLTSNGYSIRYADVADVQRMFKRLRKSNVFGRPFRHFSVSELGSKKARPHFHILFLIPKYEGDDYNTPLQLEKVMFDVVLSEWRRNYGSRRNPIWKPCCTYVRKFVCGKLRTNYDLHYVHPFGSKNCEADVAFYVTKYMMKPSDRAVRLRQALHFNLSEEEYNEIWSLVKPRHFESENFGLCSDKPPDSILRHLKKGISSSKGCSDYPLFINPVNGKTFPLARYYKSKGFVYSVDDFYDFFYNAKHQPEDNVIIRDDYDVVDVDSQQLHFDKNVQIVDLKSDSNSFDFLYET